MQNTVPVSQNYIVFRKGPYYWLALIQLATLGATFFCLLFNLGSSNIPDQAFAYFFFAVLFNLLSMGNMFWLWMIGMTIDKPGNCLTASTIPLSELVVSQNDVSQNSTIRDGYSSDEQASEISQSEPSLDHETA